MGEKEGVEVKEMEEKKMYLIVPIPGEDEFDEIIIEESTPLRAAVKALEMMKDRDEIFFLIYEDDEEEPIETTARKYDGCFVINMSYPWGAFFVCPHDDGDSFSYMRIQ